MPPSRIVVADVRTHFRASEAFILIAFPLQLRSLPLSPWLCVSVRTRSALRQPASFEHSRRHGDAETDARYLPPPVTLSSSLSVALCLCENQKRPTAASQLRALPASSAHAGTETRRPMRVIFPLQLRSLPLSPWLCVSVRTRSALRQPASFEHCQLRALTQARRRGDRCALSSPSSYALFLSLRGSVSL